MYNANMQLSIPEYTRSTIQSGNKVMSVFVVTAIILGSIVFPAPALGHDIDVNQAKQKMERYALTVVQNSRYDPTPNVACHKMFPHQVRCRISYTRYSGTNLPKQTCSEDITVYFVAHMGSRRDWTYYATHINQAAYCGHVILFGPRP